MNRKPETRLAFQAFGADRMMWGGLGMNIEPYRKNSDLFNSTFDFTTDFVRDKIRGANAMKLFYF